MKHIILIFFIVLSCKNNPHKEQISNLKQTLDTITFNDTDSYYKYRSFLVNNKHASTYNELCKIDSIKAQIDIKKDRLTFFIGYNRNRDFPSLKELPNLLKKYNINTVELLPSCIINDSTKYEECYERLMHKAIKEKNGIGFLNKIKQATDSIYLLKNSDKVHTTKSSFAMFQIMISIDYQKWKNSINDSFSKQITIPKDYRLKNDGITNIYAEFIITKNGKIDSLYTASNNIDKRFQSFLEKEAKQYIRKMQWTPFEVYGMKLNTKEHFFLKL